MGTREGVAVKIEKDAKLKLDEMNRQLSSNKEIVIQEILNFVYDIEPKIHKNYRQD